MLGISNRRKNGLKWAFVSIEFRKNTYFNCAFMHCFAPESDLQRCLFSVLGISNRRKNGLKWAFVSIEFRKNTYFNCAFMHCFAPESDLQN